MNLLLTYYKKYQFHSRKVFIFSTILLAVSLPNSHFGMSVAELLLTLNWLAEGNLRNKLQRLIRRKSILLIISIYVIHLLGLINTCHFIDVFRLDIGDLDYGNNIKYAIRDLRIKLPLLMLPVIYGTTKSLSKKELTWILRFFIASLLVTTMIETIIWFGFPSLLPANADNRNISIFISHIRLSLLIILALFLIIYNLLFRYDSLSRIEIMILVLSTLWFLYFLILLRSLTGILIFCAIIPFFLLYWTYVKKKDWIRYVTFFVLLIGFLYILITTVRIYSLFEKENNIIVEALPTHTINGNQYEHDTLSKRIENGNLIWLYVCDKELKNEWEKRSSLKYFDKDYKNQELRRTLIRYLTSKGLTKDSVGISKLSNVDIRYIENGYANYIYGQRFGLYPRLYQIFWELDVYIKEKDPSGHSFTQRIEYMKAAMHIIKNSFWAGVGTGDVKVEFDKAFNDIHSPLDKFSRGRAHNQFITFLITFGIFGFLWIMFSLIAPVFLEKKQKDFYFMIFFIISFLSMLNEDTLETHAGISFFAFFLALFLFGKESSIGHEKTE